MSGRQWASNEAWAYALVARRYPSGNIPANRVQPLGLLLVGNDDPESDATSLIGNDRSGMLVGWTRKQDYAIMGVAAREGTELVRH